eukprot:1143308-Pelagomonas_calceolata.AAC.3
MECFGSFAELWFRRGMVAKQPMERHHKGYRSTIITMTMTPIEYNNNMKRVPPYGVPLNNDDNNIMITPIKHNNDTYE